MSLTYCGTATIDKQLYLHKSNEAFFDFVGKDIYGSVTDFIRAEDVERFREAFSRLINNKMSHNVSIVRKLTDKTETEWLLVDMAPEPFLLEGELLVNLRFYAYKRAESIGEESNQEKTVHEIFFEMSESTMFLYDKNRNELNILAGMEGQSLSLYHGTPEKWKTEVMEGAVAQEDAGILETLCNDIINGKPRFEYEISTGAFSQTSAMENFIFKGRTLKKDDGFLVVGSVTAAGQSASTGSTYVMDAGLPILCKRSIIEYAKNAFVKNQDKTYLVIVDLDDFKTINDTHGHLFGDEVLVRVVKVIKDAIGKSGTAGRIGGDEFLIVLNWIESPVELRNMLRCIRTGIEWAFRGEKDDIHITCSIGAAAYPDNGDSYDKVFQLADRMLYVAKSKGKNRYVIYVPELHDPAVAAEAQKRVKERSNTALKDDKIGVMHRLIEEFMVRKIVTYEAQFRELLACFELDRITMVYSNLEEAITLEDDVFTNIVDERIYLKPEEGFMDSFDKNNIFVVNGRFNVEGKAPILCKLMENQGIESAIFYKLVKNDKVFGYVMFAKKSRRQMWSESEKILLACVGKALEMSFFGK